MERFTNSWGAIIRFTLLSLVCGFSGWGFAQNSPKNYIECNHDALISVLRAYEDSLALSSSNPVVRVDYAWSVADVAVAGKVYKIYRCEALNDSLEVLMEEVAFARMTPPTVDTDSIGSISGTGATFYGKVTSDGDTAVTAQWFKYGLSAGSLSDSLAVSGVVTPFSAVVSGLANGTTYYVAAFAKNVKGTSPGDTLSFTTHAAPGVDTDAASALAATAATLNATITATGGTAVSATGFKYATNSALTTPSDIAGSGTSSPFTASLTSLSPGTQYWAVGYATNSVGTSYGDTITFTTNAVAPTVDSDAASSVTSSAATLNATITATGGAAVSATGFKYATNSALTTPSNIAGSGTSSPFTASLTSLSPGTQYWAVGYATNSVGTSYGDTITFTTNAVAPTVDSDAASSVTSSAATLSASITATGGAAVSATGFKYATNAALTAPSDIAGSGTSNPFTGSLNGLTASTQYWAVGYATNSVGTSYGDTITFTTSAAASAFTCGTSTVTYDGHAYTTVLFGTQCWFKENLRNDNYRDGTAIPGNLTASAWSTTTSGAQTVYDEGGANGAANLITYGRLYNWYAVTNAAGLCPTGWHVPTDAEWTALETHLGGASIAGSKMKTAAWGGDNSSGFTALPGGGRNGSSDGAFTLLGDRGFFWSSSPSGSDAWSRWLFSAGPQVIRDSYGETIGFSVRCLQDPATAPTVDTEAATSVTATAATLNATITATGGAAVSATGFKYATNAALTTPSDVAGSGTSSPFTGSLTSLSTGTQYWAVGYATNSVGTSYGDTITFTTPFTCGTSTVTYDGHAYTTVSIGSQCWFKENLRNDNYRDGTAIPGNLNNSSWTSTTSGAQTVYNQGGPNEASNLTTYGRLYNWYAVTNAAGLCPTGWHVPTDAEWTALETHLGPNAGDQLKATSPTWDGTNSSGFSALPGGFRSRIDGSFDSFGNNGYWWSSSFAESLLSGSLAWYRDLYNGGSEVNRDKDFVRGGFSVRCVQD